MNLMEKLERCSCRSDDDNSIYQRALLTFGGSVQIEMMIEEMAELIFALQKAKRDNNYNNINIIEEIVDVEIMIKQLKIMFNTGYEEVKEVKLKRLEDYIKKYEDEKKK